MNTSIQVLEEDIKDLEAALADDLMEYVSAGKWFYRRKLILERMEKELAELKAKQ